MNALPLSMISHQFLDVQKKKCINKPLMFMGKGTPLIKMNKTNLLSNGKKTRSLVLIPKLEAEGCCPEICGAKEEEYEANILSDTNVKDDYKNILNILNNPLPSAYVQSNFNPNNIPTPFLNSNSGFNPNSPTAAGSNNNGLENRGTNSSLTNTLSASNNMSCGNIGSINSMFSIDNSSIASPTSRRNGLHPTSSIGICNNSIKFLKENRFVGLFEDMKYDLNFSSFSEEFLVALEKAIQKYLFKGIPIIPNFYEFDELRIEMRRNDWQEVDMLYRILSMLIKRDFVYKPKPDNGNNNHQVRLVNKKFVNNLVSLYLSPDTSESSSIDMLIGEIKDLFPLMIRTVFFSILGLLQMHNEGSIQYFGIKSLLIQLHRIISNSDQVSYVPIQSSCILNILLGLFNSTYLSEFYEQLRITLRVVNVLCPKDQGEVIDYFIAHWPIKNSNKVYFFLKHIFYLMKDYKPLLSNQQKKLIMEMFRISLTSLNYKVSAKIISMLFDKSTVIQLKNDFSIGFFYKLINDLDVISHDHWCQTIREFAARAEEQLMIFMKLKKNYFLKKNSSTIHIFDNFQIINFKEETNEFKQICEKNGGEENDAFLEEMRERRKNWEIVYLTAKHNTQHL